MKNSRLIRLILLVGITCVIATCAYALQTKHREFNHTKEKEVKIIIDVSFGSISIEQGVEDKIAVVEYEEEEADKQKLYVSYDISDEIGTLRIKMKESTHFWGDENNHKNNHRHLYLKLGNSVPISFDVELDAGNGDIDLTGLQVKDAKISTGASNVTMRCGEPNPVTADDIVIESGVSKFTATNLGNLNFRNLKFSGGIGSYKLDFNGAFRQSAEVEIEVGLGSIKVDVPKALPTKLVYDDNWLSSFNIDDDFEKIHNDVYETKDYQDASKRLTIKMESGLGSVRVSRK